MESEEFVVSVGVPRGLLYYHYGKAWEEFFRNLGLKVVTSGETSKITIDTGGILDEVCLPVKVYLGHVYELYKKVDYLFIPRIISVDKRMYTCPKIIGLPDMIKSNIADLPPVIDVDINVFNKRRELISAVLKIGKQVGCNTWSTLNAWYQANKCYRDEQACKQKAYTELTAKHSKVIGLIAHPYISNDALISMNIMAKLKNLNINVITADMVANNIADKNAAFLEKKLFWSYCQHLVGSANFLLNMPELVGLIVMTSFGCGPDSLASEVIKRQAKQNNIPYLLLTIDEHTAENAFVTRLEAFIDMLNRRCFK